MNNVIVNANHVALVFKRKELIEVLTTGKYWVGFGKEVVIYNMDTAHHFLTSELDMLLQNTDFLALIHLMNVGDNELVLVYQNNNFKHVLAAGRHVIWKSLSTYSFIKADLSSIEIDEAIDRNLFEKLPLSSYVRKFKVESYEDALLFVDDKYKSQIPPGSYTFWKNSTNVQVLKADTRLQNMEITGQEILTKDKAQLRINFSIQYKVTSIERALLGNKDFEKQLYITIQLALRECVGLMTFDDLMESKDQIAAMVTDLVAEKAKALGVSLTNCGVKDIILPGDVKEIMNQVLVAEKRAQANTITRREETASTRSLLNIARLMEENAMLYKLKEMEYVEKIAEKINTISLSGSGQIVDQLKQIFVK